MHFVHFIHFYLKNRPESEQSECSAGLLIPFFQRSKMLFGGKMIPAFFFAVGFLVSEHKKKFCFFNALRSLHSLLPEKQT